MCMVRFDDMPEVACADRKTNFTLDTLHLKRALLGQTPFLSGLGTMETLRLDSQHGLTTFDTVEC